MASPAKNSSNGNGRELAEALADIKASLAIVTTRIGANEADYQRLARDQHQLAQNVEKGLAEIRQSLSERNKTPWGVIFSGFSITLALAVAIGSLALSPLRDKDAGIEESMRVLRTDMMPRGEVEVRIHAAILEARLAATGK